MNLTTVREVNAIVERESLFLHDLVAEINKVIVGQETLVDRVLIALLADGHILLEGVPGLAKTLLIKTVAEAIDADPAFREELLDGMAAQIERLQPLLDNLTQLHGGVPGSLELNRRKTDLAPWLVGVIAPWKAAAQSKDLGWQSSIPSDLPAVTIDPDRMAQAVGNLLSNAVKYTPAGETAGIVVSERGDILVIAVHDTGSGIEPAEIDKIFQPYR